MRWCCKNCTCRTLFIADFLLLRVTVRGFGVATGLPQRSVFVSISADSGHTQMRQHHIFPSPCQCQLRERWKWDSYVSSRVLLWRPCAATGIQFSRVVTFCIFYFQIAVFIGSLRANGRASCRCLGDVSLAFISLLKFWVFEFYACEQLRDH